MSKFCSFCKAAGKTEEVWKSHYVREKKGGEVSCPALLANECGYCHGIGHTPKFCPKLKARNARRKRCSSTRGVKPARVLASFTAGVQKQMRQSDATALEQKRARARCSDNQYAELMGAEVRRPKRAPQRKPPVNGPKAAQPRAPQGAWGAAAKVAENVRNLDQAEVEELKTLLRNMGIMDPPAFSAEAAAAASIAASLTSNPNPAEQAWLEAQMAKKSQTLEETAEGEAFFDNVADTEDAVMAVAAGVPGNPPPVALPDTCDLDADFGTPQHGDGGWGSC
ncbi:hypothetical protein [uncultured Mediterranean phage]|nr:hypothetical protein [uncultured Mediterranean phage]